MMLSNYKVLSMGNNSKGQLGLGMDFPSSGTANAENVQLPDNLLAASVYAGTAHSMILTTDGAAFALRLGQRTPPNQSKSTHHPFHLDFYSSM